MNKNLLFIKSIFQEKIDSIKEDFIADKILKESRYTLLNNIFDHVPFVIYIMNIETFEVYLTSNELRNLIGYSPTEFEQFSVNLLNYIHPVDKEKIAGNDFKIFIDQIKSLNNKQLENSRFSKNYRLKHKNGEYIHCLDQSVILNIDEQKEIILVVGILMDISAHKSDEEVTLTISEYTQENDKQLIFTQNIFSQTAVTEREKEILILLANGAKSSEIASQLNISVHTVNTHRSNLLGKFKSKNTKELIQLVRKEGFV